MKRNNIAKFHSEIRYTELDTIFSLLNKNISILDISVGRGADLFKFTKTAKSQNKKINMIYGLDIDKNALIEAQSRWDENIEKNSRPEFYLDCCDMNNDNFVSMIKKKTKKKFNLVVCNFAFHYFFNNRENVMRILNRLKSVVLKNCIFWFCCPDGDKLLELKNVKNNVYSLNIDRSNITDYGTLVQYSLEGTVYFTNVKDNKFLDNGVSFEYLVRKEIITKLLEEMKIEIVSIKHFNELFEGSKIKLNFLEKEISFTNMSCIYKLY